MNKNQYHLNIKKQYHPRVPTFRSLIRIEAPEWDAPLRPYLINKCWVCPYILKLYCKTHHKARKVYKLVYGEEYKE